MHATRVVHDAYRQTVPLGSPKEQEYKAIARITHQLKNAAQLGKGGFSQLVKALHENRRLWTILAANVADPENALRPDTRAQLFYLAEFTQAHSSKVLKGKARVRPLIEINMALLRGLREEVSER